MGSGHHERAWAGRLVRPEVQLTQGLQRRGCRANA